MTSTDKTMETGIDSREIQDFEFVTMSGQDYVCVYLDGDRWKREAGCLEPREALHHGTVGEWMRARVG